MSDGWIVANYTRQFDRPNQQVTNRGPQLAFETGRILILLMVTKHSADLSIYPVIHLHDINRWSSKIDDFPTRNGCIHGVGVAL